ncbi:MAG: DUF3800 domain-containing protein [Lachnospiraceae bacterium]|nr:DUF3800 domain-containing protein [Lachnospiraceae bacterium]
MKELSIFVDESGDFGEYDYRSPFYIVSLVFHDQSKNLKKDLIALEKELENIGWGCHCVHAGPVIRSEEDYQGCDLKERQKILKRMMTFVRHLDITFKSIYIEKKQIEDLVDATGKLSKQLAAFIRDNQAFFSNFDKVKVYYDNGQVELTRILSSVLNSLLDNVEFRKVIPADYRLFQVADLICTLKLAELKMQEHTLSKSERYFFEDEKTLKKNYLKPLAKKEMQHKSELKLNKEKQ